MIKYTQNANQANDYNWSFWANFNDVVRRYFISKLEALDKVNCGTQNCQTNNDIINSIIHALKFSLMFFKKFKSYSWLLIFNNTAS